ncbi:MAG: Lrp/AsnC family transcriptional regulator, partial [Thaumarchaeota archaeon]|nr:Lrp/AsnC family transcriptional regulator [Nitrososphaerota archaeon]
MEPERYVLDDIDVKILELLRKDGRMSFIDIGKKVGLSEGAVRRRVKLLQERGIIKKFTIEIDRSYGVSAVTFIQLEPGSSPKQVVEKVANIPGVEVVYELTGRFDVIAILSAPSIG